MNILKYPMLASAGVVLLLFLALLAYHAPPPVKDADVPTTQFSGMRAWQQLTNLLAENVPHPVGSKANQRIRDRLLEQLQRLGLETEVQRVFECARVRRSCAQIENVLARLPGTDSDASSVLLMAHYDSVPASPGAGDDGAGVAALLETARALTVDAPFPHPVIFAFTDAEEVGLIGAKAFFRRHPWAKSVGVVLNLESGGSSGVSRLLRIGPDSGWLVKAYAASAPKVVANSINAEIFKRLPNDTDFSVAQNFDLPGLDFAFANMRHHYHTPLDDLTHLNQGSLQHHGDNLLTLTRKLARGEITPTTGSALAYTDIFGVMFLSWSLGWNFPLVLLACGVGGIMVFRLRDAGRLRFREALLGLAAPFLMVAGIVTVGIALMQPVQWWHDGVNGWPAYSTAWQWLIWAITVLVGLNIGRLLFICGFWTQVSGICLFWALLSLCAAIYAPAASPVLLLPALWSSLSFGLLGLSKYREARLCKIGVCLSNVLVSGYFCLLLYFGIAQTFGYGITALLFLGPGLLMTHISPLYYLESSTLARQSLYLATLAVVLGLVAVLCLPRYALHRPQHLNLVYFADTDVSRASWLVPEASSLPATLAKTYPFAPLNEPLYPWQNQEDNKQQAFKAPAPFVNVGAPRIQIVSSVVDEQVTTVKLHILPSSLSLSNVLFLPAFRISGMYAEKIPLTAVQHAWELEEYGHYLRVRFNGLPTEGIYFTLDILGDLPFEMLAVNELAGLAVPDGKYLQSQRGAAAVPKQRGDVSLMLKRYKLM